MSLTISRAEGVTVYTVQSNNKSNWPLICQILATLQIMVGIMNLGFGSLFIAYPLRIVSEFGPAFLALGAVITAVGVMCILAEKFPSPCLVVLTVMMNIVSTALAVTTIVLYSVDLSQRGYSYWCRLPDRQENSYQYFWTTASPGKKAKLEEIYQNKLKNYRVCEENKLMMKNIHMTLDIVMLVLAVLHFCVTISWSVLSVKALRKKKADGQDVEDPELRKDLIDHEISAPVC